MWIYNKYQEILGPTLLALMVESCLHLERSPSKHFRVKYDA